MEISDTTTARDLKVKLPAYGRAGIPEVWIINRNELTVEVYREPYFDGYASKNILLPGEVATPKIFPDLAVDVAALLKR